MHSMRLRFKWSFLAPQIKTSCITTLGLEETTPAAIDNSIEDIR